MSCGDKPHEGGGLATNGGGVAYCQQEALLVHVSPHGSDVFLEAFALLFETVKLAYGHSGDAGVVLMDFFSTSTTPLWCPYTPFDSDHLSTVCNAL